MQEEIEHKTVNFAISTVKLSARTLLKGAQFFLRQYDKSASQGKQSMNRLIRQNRGVTNLEIEKTGIKDPERADRYKTLRKRNYGAQKPSARPANAARQGRERPAFAESRNFSLHQRRKCVAERNPCRNDYRARRETQGTGRPL